MRFSIIIPVYNVEPYLYQCIFSLFEQTFVDFEIIAIDDGSTDGSFDVLRSMQVLDKRLKIYRKSNEGLSVTRNLGVQEASGDYVVFLDSDDFLDVNALQTIQNRIIKYNLDAVFFAAESFSDEGLVVDKSYIRPLSLLEYVMSGREFFYKSLKINCFYPSACLYVVKSSISKRLFFYPGVYYEDNLYTVQMLFDDSSRHVMAIRDPLYRRRVRSGSITNSDLDIKHSDDKIEIVKELIRFRKKINGISVFDFFLYNKLLLGLLRSSFIIRSSNVTISIKERFSYLVMLFNCSCPGFFGTLFLFVAPSMYWRLRKIIK